MPEADLDNESADSPASREALALLILLEGTLFASLMSGLLLSPSKRSFEPNECLGFRGASELALMLVWKRAIRSLADLPLFSSGSGLNARNKRRLCVSLLCVTVYTNIGRHRPKGAYNARNSHSTRKAGRGSLFADPASVSPRPSR